ncbi:MAG: integrase arm-type DNA-binding domain-containing protein [Rudaea sp.]
MLTSSAVHNAKSQIKAYKLADERGMYLLVKPDGGRWWRFDYRRPGTPKRNTLSLGIYPDVSLKKARERRDEARTLLADGIDPGEKRKAETLAGADTFEAIAREWYEKHASTWAPTHGEKIIRRLERDVFPWIGSKPIAGITAPDLLAVLRRIESRGAVETAHRAHQNCGQIFRYAIATGRATANPAPALRGSLTPWKPQHYPAITDPDQIGNLLRAIDAFTGTFTVACALKLAPMLFVRPGELRQAEWVGFDLDAGEWRYHVTKTDADHIVPLSSQAVAILRELWPLTGSSRFVFPGMRDRKKPLSNMALNAALRRMGYDKHTMTGHGFRAMARTVLDEHLGFRPDFIEHQLAHAVRDPNGRAYNRTAHLVERRKMMQSWADYLDGLRASPRKVVPIKRKAS